jgi:3-phenylpropionate/cinnamic acid dioxygenase small subunit
MLVSKEVSPEIDAAIRRLLARYCQLVDDGDFDAAVDLFSDDARYIILGEELKGREAIRGALSDHKTETTLHQVTNVVVSNGSHDGTFHSVSDLALTAKRDTWTPVFAGRYHDTFTGTGRDMRFTQRILTAR